MKEIAFTVEPNSTLYANYFAQKEERERSLLSFSTLTFPAALASC